MMAPMRLLGCGVALAVMTWASLDKGLFDAPLTWTDFLYWLLIGCVAGGAFGVVLFR